MRFTPYSFSKISLHKQCPRKFKYRYIDRVKPEQKDMTALLKGGAVHSILEHYPQQSTHKLAPDYQYIVDKFSKSELGKKYLSTSSIREFDFGLTTELKPTEYNDKNALFRGSVDFICTIDNVLYLCDWKSGSYKEPKWQVYDQLMYYSVYFFQRYSNINKIVISYVYIEHNEHENTITLEREHLNSYVQQLIDPIKLAETDQSFQKCTSKLCDYCEFKTHCKNDIL